ncbi:MAG: hypothetical protein LBP34_08915, partial [Flavobacteriaceae bacterium]|nr:hypothetical protein [Flavobacteriaceae bacterium]
MKLSTLQIRYISILLLIVMLIQSFTPYVPVLDREEQNGEKREKRESILSEISPDKNRKTHLRKVSGKEVSLAETQDISSEETVQTVIYRSPQQEGIIGLTAGKNFDNPEDNHFTIELNKVPTKGQKIYLSYELYGVSDKSGISRSINDRLSRGGYQVTTNHSWSRQKEELDADWLTAGKNHIRFSIPSGADWGYIIKNLTLEIESPEAERSEDETKETVVVTSCIQSGEETYVRGFIKNPSPGNTGKSLTLNGKPVSLYEGEFEVVLSEKVSEIQLNLNGEPLQQTIISTPVSDRPDYRYPLNLQITQTRKTFRQNTADNKLELSGAVLEVLGSRLLSDKELSLQTLRSQDLPALEMSMENVTAQAEGYRFLPHGEHFKEEGAVVKLTYDRTKIPNGYNEQDIRTFYFDPDTRHWVALERDSLDIQNQEVISRTTHFTDMINGILKTPESPETAGFTPTQMSDIKAADPTAKVQLISPPGVNNRGSANLSYSFELPPARNGMSPSLGIQYSSDGGSGLLGEGWDLNIPGITVDTRWGVPRYDLSKETEVYLLDGTQLMTRDSQGNNYLAHRKEKISREANRLFFSRKEGSFSKIQRKGNSPGNYVWEVTDRKGVKYTYGGNNGSMKGIYIDVKQQAREVISQWRLSRVEELHGDWIEYIYERVDEPVRGGLTSKALYLKEIHAGNKGESAHTVIKLLREATKQKQTSNAGYGYLSSSNRLLTKIEIEFESEKLREYEFQYKPGAFHTDLLDKIVQKDGKGEEFNSHRFEYYDDVRSGEYFKGGETWNTRNDGVSGGLVNPVSKLQFNDFSDQTTALGGNKSTSVSGSMYVGVGSLGSTFLKSLTAGASFNYSYSEGQGLSTLADINGDGIPDKIFKSNGSLYYRGGSRSGNFGPSIKIENLNEFSTTYSNSTSYGGKFFFGVQTGTDQQTTKTQISRYFSDVNADGLMDMVVGGSTVYFNHIEKDPQGNLVPTFTTSSGDTPSPINGGGIIDDSDTAVDPEEQAELIEDHPLQDVVRIWTAPCDGKVNITGSATLQQPQSGAKPANDGVRLTIQHNTTKNVFTQPILYPTILKSREIGATDHSAKDMSHNGLEVKAGDRLYFRVQSGTEEDSNGENDRVNWSPQVSYTTAIPQDPNGYSQNYSSSSAIVSDEGILLVPVKDSYTIKGKFIKPVTTDSLTLKILLGTEVVYEQTYTDQQTYNGELTLPLTNDKQADQIQFILESSSAIAWDKIHWNPKVSYTDIIENTLVETESPGSVKYKGVYPRVFRYGEPQTVKNAGTAKLITGIDFNSGTTQKQKEAVEGSYTLTVKKQTGIIYKGLVEIKKGKITQGDSIQIPLPAGKLWVELFSDDPNIKLDS